MALRSVEIAVCDLCDKPDPELEEVKLGWNGTTWLIDLCPTDKQKVESTFDSWIALHLRPATQERKQRVKAATNGHKPKTARKAAESRTDRIARNDEYWAVLSKKGFDRHKGQLKAEEKQILIDAGFPL